MKLLDIKEVTTPRQARNGTREFELPIKYRWGKRIRLASFKTGYVRNQRVLIQKEVDRLEYLLKFAIKNYYIRHANQVANGEFIPKWKYESYKDEYKNRVNEVNNPEVSVIVNGHRYNL